MSWNPYPSPQQQQIDVAIRAYTAKGKPDSWPKPGMEELQLYGQCLKNRVKYKVSSITRKKRSG